MSEESTVENSPEESTSSVSSATEGISPAIEAGSPLVAEEENSAESASIAMRRDVPVSALVHLLGLPTSAELSVIESKVDTLSARLSSLGTKFDRLSQQVGTLANEFYIDRIDFQISEIRTLMKKVFPHVVKEGDFQSGSLREAKKQAESRDAETPEGE